MAVHVALCLKDVYRSKHIILLSIILIQRIKANRVFFGNDFAMKIRPL